MIVTQGNTCTYINGLKLYFEFRLNNNNINQEKQNKTKHFFNNQVTCLV